jgi:hypothetical protein
MCDGSASFGEVHLEQDKHRHAKGNCFLLSQQRVQSASAFSRNHCLFLVKW